MTTNNDETTTVTITVMSTTSSIADDETVAVEEDDDNSSSSSTTVTVATTTSIENDDTLIVTITYIDEDGSDVEDEEDSSGSEIRDTEYTLSEIVNTSITKEVQNGKATLDGLYIGDMASYATDYNTEYKKGNTDYRPSVNVLMEYEGTDGQIYSDNTTITIQPALIVMYCTLDNNTLSSSTPITLTLNINYLYSGTYVAAYYSIQLGDVSITANYKNKYTDEAIITVGDVSDSLETTGTYTLTVKGAESYGELWYYPAFYALGADYFRVFWTTSNEVYYIAPFDLTTFDNWLSISDYPALYSSGYSNGTYIYSGRYGATVCNYPLERDGSWKITSKQQTTSSNRYMLGKLIWNVTDSSYSDSNDLQLGRDVSDTTFYGETISAISTDTDYLIILENNEGILDCTLADEDGEIIVETEYDLSSVVEDDAELYFGMRKWSTGNAICTYLNIEEY